MIGNCASCTEQRELVPDIIDGKRVAICRWCRDGEIGRGSPGYHSDGGRDRTVESGCALTRAGVFGNTRTPRARGSR